MLAGTNELSLVLEGPRAAQLAARLEAALPLVREVLESALSEPDERPVGAEVRAPISGAGPSEGQGANTVWEVVDLPTPLPTVARHDNFQYLPEASVRADPEVPAAVLGFARTLTSTVGGGGLARVSRAYGLGRAAAVAFSEGRVVTPQVRENRVTAYAYLVLSTAANFEAGSPLERQGPFWTRSRQRFLEELRLAEQSELRTLFVGVDIGTLAEAEAYFRGAGYTGLFPSLRQ